LIISRGIKIIGFKYQDLLMLQTPGTAEVRTSVNLSRGAREPYNNNMLNGEFLNTLALRQEAMTLNFSICTPEN
jgi:hypothetical protein